MIDLLGSVIPNDAEIESNMQELINATWPPALREKVLRTGVGKVDLDNFFASMTALKLKAIADRNLLAATLKYEQAASRLASPALDINAADAAGNLLYPLDEEGVNANIEKDLSELADAQLVIDNASAEVITLATKRNPVEAKI